MSNNLKVARHIEHLILQPNGLPGDWWLNKSENVPHVLPQEMWCAPFSRKSVVSIAWTPAWPQWRIDWKITEVPWWCLGTICIHAMLKAHQPLENIWKYENIIEDLSCKVCTSLVRHNHHLSSSLQKNIKQKWTQALSPTAWQFFCLFIRSHSVPKPSAPEPSGTWRQYLQRNPLEPHLGSAPEPSGTSPRLCTGTLRNLTEALHQDLPEAKLSICTGTFCTLRNLAQNLVLMHRIAPEQIWAKDPIAKGCCWGRTASGNDLRTSCFFMPFSISGHCAVELPIFRPRRSWEGPSKNIMRSWEGGVSLWGHKDRKMFDLDSWKCWNEHVIQEMFPSVTCGKIR